MDYKKRVENAMGRYYERQENKDKYEPKRENEAPEKDVEQKVLVWLKLNCFDVDVVEAKSKFNTSTMRYSGRAASPGMSDLVGNCPDGVACFIELKAPGRRVGSALRENQREFITRKILCGCFALVVDSVEYLEKTWKHFSSLPTRNERTKFLLNELPEHNPRQLKIDL